MAIYRRIGPARVEQLAVPGDADGAAPRHVQVDLPARMLLPGWRNWRNSILLRRFGVACVVINRKYEVLHFAGPTEHYLVQPAGPPTQNLLSLAREPSNPSCASSFAGPSAKKPPRASRA